jgi:hypothetical protein
MKINLFKPRFLGWLCAGMLVAGLAAGCGQRRQLTIRVFIDGSDVVKLSGTRLWIEHETFRLPEKAISVNGIAWSPNWTNNISNAFEGVSPGFRPRDPQKIRIAKRAGRGEVTTVQMPTAENDETLAFRISDKDFDGADWYEVVVTW